MRKTQFLSIRQISRRFSVYRHCLSLRVILRLWLRHDSEPESGPGLRQSNKSPSQLVIRYSVTSPGLALKADIMIGENTEHTV